MTWEQGDWWGVTHQPQEEKPSMSRGTPTRTMRVPEEFAERVQAALDSANEHGKPTPYTWSSWILKAAGEKLRHLERGRESSRRRRQKGNGTLPRPTE